MPGMSRIEEGSFFYIQFVSIDLPHKSWPEVLHMFWMGSTIQSASWCLYLLWPHLFFLSLSACQLHLYNQSCTCPPEQYFTQTGLLTQTWGPPRISLVRFGKFYSIYDQGSTIMCTKLINKQFCMKKSTPKETGLHEEKHTHTDTADSKGGNITLGPFLCSVS